MQNNTAAVKIASGDRTQPGENVGASQAEKEKYDQPRFEGWIDDSGDLVGLFIIGNKALSVYQFDQILTKAQIRALITRLQHELEIGE